MDTFLDAEEVFGILLDVEGAKGLVKQLLSEDAHMAEGSAPNRGVEALIEQGFLVTPEALVELTATLKKTRGKLTEATEAAKEAERQSKTLDVRLRHVNRSKPKLGILRSKVEKWDTATREVGLKRQSEQMAKDLKTWIARRDALQSQWEELVEEIEKVAQGTMAKWYASRPIVMTKHGRFLLDSLSEMKSDHFKGRTLAEVLVVGHLLA